MHVIMFTAYHRATYSKRIWMLAFVGISERIVKNSRDITLLAASVFASGILISSHTRIYQDISKTLRERGHVTDLGVDGTSLKAILNDWVWRAWNDFFWPRIGRGISFTSRAAVVFQEGPCSVSKMYLVMHVIRSLSSKMIAFTWRRSTNQPPT